MTRVVFLGNAALTLPFALVGLVAPALAFDAFGIQLDASGALIARGYASTCLGYGLAFALARDAREPAVQTALLAASLAFNAAEVAVQLPAALAGIASGGVWVTVVGHGALAGLTVAALAGRRAQDS